MACGFDMPGRPVFSEGKWWHGSWLEVRLGGVEGEETAVRMYSMRKEFKKIKKCYENAMKYNNKYNLKCSHFIYVYMHACIFIYICMHVCIVCVCV